MGLCEKKPFGSIKYFLLNVQYFVISLLIFLYFSRQIFQPAWWELTLVWWGGGQLTLLNSLEPVEVREESSFLVMILEEVHIPGIVIFLATT